MTIRMIAVDMDGTFLNHESCYDHARFLKAYGQMKEKGITFVVASGNPLRQLKGNFPEVADELTYIAENGAYIVDGTQQLFLDALDADNVQAIIACLKAHPDVMCWACTKDQSYALNSMSQAYFEMFLPYFPGVKRIEDFSLITDPILKFALYLPEKNVVERMVDFASVTDDQVHVVDSGHYCVDLIPAHINKGEGMRFLMERLHLSQDEVMAFGDAGNDVEMLKSVTYGYVMANAKADMREQFAYQAPSNDDQGVLQIIEAYLADGTILNFKE